MKTKFKEGVVVNIDESYLNDEACDGHDCTSKATVLSEPKDDEELVCILYETGTIDFVPQYILELIN